MKTLHLLKTWQGIREGLFQVLDSFTLEDLDYRPFPDSYSVREIVLHIAQEEYGEVQYGLTRQLQEFPPAFESDDYPTIDSLKSLLRDVHDQTLSYLDGLDEGALESEIEAGWGGTFLLVDLLWHVLEHEIHHRGELSLILGLLGKQGLDA
jgi:uncharacterized damage-inducible protein DinB